MASVSIFLFINNNITNIPVIRIRAIAAYALFTRF